ncbi:MAG: hypothetical protein ACO1OC_01610 [Tuberibacillus sp.]
MNPEPTVQSGWEKDDVSAQAVYSTVCMIAPILANHNAQGNVPWAFFSAPPHHQTGLQENIK